MIMPLPDLMLRPLIDAALAEDLGRAGDLTSTACVDKDARLNGVFAARQDGCIVGLDWVRLTLLALDPQARIVALAADGQNIAAGSGLLRVEANARALLAAERTALNMLGRLSGIATLTRSYVRAVEGTTATITDTRKTTPMLRALEKYAVRCGGGINHRFGLDDAILIKDNHVVACGGVGEAVRRARAAAGHLVKIEVEIDRLDQLEQALAAGPDVVMLDNFVLADLRAAVAKTAGRAMLEASGGVNLTAVRAIAETGVSVISVGALTHSAPALDVGLDV